MGLGNNTIQSNTPLRVIFGERYAQIIFELLASLPTSRCRDFEALVSARWNPTKGNVEGETKEIYIADCIPDTFHLYFNLVTLRTAPMDSIHETDFAKTALELYSLFELAIYCDFISDRLALNNAVGALHRFLPDDLSIVDKHFVDGIYKAFRRGVELVYNGISGQNRGIKGLLLDTWPRYQLAAARILTLDQDIAWHKEFQVDFADHLAWRVRWTGRLGMSVETYME